MLPACTTSYALRWLTRRPFFATRRCCSPRRECISSVLRAQLALPWASMTLSRSWRPSSSCFGTRGTWVMACWLGSPHGWEQPCSSPRCICGSGIVGEPRQVFLVGARGAPCAGATRGAHCSVGPKLGVYGPGYPDPFSGVKRARRRTGPSRFWLSRTRWTA